MPTPVSTGSLTIADLNDGLYALLSSETGLVPCDSAGTPTTPLLTSPLTTLMTVYKGNSVQTGFSFARTASSGVVSAVNASGVLSVTGLSPTVDGGWVDITASKAGEPSITKRYVVSKVKQGIQGPQGTTGQTGAPGANAPYLKTQYSKNGTTLWHDVFTAGDLYMRTSNNNGSTYSTGMRIVGEDGANGTDGQAGADGSWYKFEFAKNTNPNSSPSTGWQDAPYVIGTGEYNWMRRGIVIPPAATPLSWSTPARMTGDKGDTGPKGTTGDTGQTGAPGANAPYLQTQYSVNGTTLWHDVFTVGNLYMRTNNGTGWSAGMRIVGEDGANGADGQKGIDGSWYKFEFAKNTSTTSPPSTGWRDEPYAIGAGEYSWMRRGLVVPPATAPASWGTSTRITGDTGAKGATGNTGPRGFDGTSVTGVTEYYLATTVSSGVTSSTAGWTTTLQPMTATKRYLWNYEKIHFSEGDDQPTIPVIIGVYGDKGDTGRAITSIQEKYLVSPNATGITRAGNTWHDTPPATTTTNKYLWNYEIINWSTGTTPTYVEPFVIGVHGATGAKGPQGIQGPAGTPGFLGLSAVGSTLYLKGFNADGSFGATTGLINFGNKRLTVPQAQYTFSAVGPGYIILDTTLSTIVPKFVKMVAVASTSSYISWRDFNTDTEIAVSADNTNFIVIATFHVEVGLIDASEIINPVLLNTYTKSHFMDLLNDRQTVTSENFSLWADAMGVTNVFTSIAAYELFVDNLTANTGFIENLGATKIKINEGGSIYSGYSADGSTPPPDGAGFHFSANGILQAKLAQFLDAEVIGTVRTGEDAPKDARVGIKDRSGITSGPTFTGSGLNDLNIMKEGLVVGDFRVKISGINNATNSGKAGYWVTPISVGSSYWQGIAVNSSGRFVAVGDDSYVSYSDDGITWATPFKVGSSYWQGVAVNSSGKFVAVGNAGYVSYSNDGITWATPFRVGTSALKGVAVNSSGRFVAVGNLGKISYSNDGITWVTPITVGSSYWEGVAVNSSGRFVAVGNYGKISYSNDGITWVTPFTVGVVSTTWYGIAVNSAGKFVAVGAGEGGYISYSNDGITWGTPFKLGDIIWYGIAVNSAGRFVAVGFNGYVSYSDDGITWVTPFKVGTKVWTSIAVNSAGKFVAVGETGYITMSLLQDTIQISSNGGTTWGSDITIPLNGAISITGFGIDILFGHFSGHTVGNYWSFIQGAMRGLVITDSGGDEYFSASNGVVTLKTLNASSINTGQGATEVHLMNQNLRTTDSTSFSGLTLASTFLPRTNPVRGGHTVAKSGTWTPPRGVYNIVPDSQMQLLTAGGSILKWTGGTVFASGTTAVQLHNTSSSSTVTVRYDKF